jgi:uncharacterized protein (TIGR00369 family)
MAAERADEDPTASRPYYRLIGIRSAPGGAPGEARLALEGRPDTENSRGEIHGGVIASLLDAAMGVAVRSAYPAGTGATTVSLTVNYLEAGRVSLIATAKVVRAGRSLCSAEATVVDASGRAVAHAIGTMRVLAAATAAPRSRTVDEGRGTTR